MSLTIFIPTKGRIETQETIKWIPEEYLEKTFLVTPEDEAEQLRAKYLGKVGGVFGTPEGITGIARTRQWIVDGQEGKIIMMDDDQHFQKRLPDKWNLKECTPDQMRELLKWMEDLLENHAMVGLSARQGNNNSFPQKIVHNVRTYNTYGLDTRILKKEGIRFDHLPLMEDFNVVLHLLRRGYTIPNIQEFCWGQQTSNAKGGCSTYRTPGLQEAAARGLAAFHPEFVKVITRNAKSWAGGLDTRIDVRVSWKKAFNSSQQEKKDGENN